MFVVFFHVDNLALKSLDWGFSVPFVTLRNILTSTGKRKQSVSNLKAKVSLGIK